MVLALILQWCSLWHVSIFTMGYKHTPTANVCCCSFCGWRTAASFHCSPSLWYHSTVLCVLPTVVQTKTQIQLGVPDSIVFVWIHLFHYSSFIWNCGILIVHAELRKWQRSRGQLYFIVMCLEVGTPCLDCHDSLSVTLIFKN